MAGFFIASFLLVQAVGAVAYADLFRHRVETPVEQCFDVSQFPGLVAKEVPFFNQKETPLAGWLYSASGQEPKGLIVLAHGMGFGHRAYLHVVDFFANNGYLVFAYDATGYDASGGASTVGVPQVLLDLDAALGAAEGLTEAAGMPVFLFGHSMGGYASCAVLPEHPEVRAVASLAGFDSVPALIRARLGLPGALLLPGAVFWERLCFGRVAGRSAMDGFTASDVRVLVVHSYDDDMVPIACGLERFAERYGTDPRFTCMTLEGRGHGALFDEEVKTACLALYEAASAGG